MEMDKIKEENFEIMRYKDFDWKNASVEDWLQFCKANKEFIEPGISYDELRALHEATEFFGHKPMRVVETGQCFGTTTRYFIVRNIKYGGDLYSYEVKVRDLFKEYMEKLDLWKYITLRKNSVKDEYDGKRIDFLFIDSEHALQDALGEYMRFRPFIYESTIIGFHDCDICPGVGKALQFINEVDLLKLISRSTDKLGAGVMFFKRIKAGRTDRPWQKQKGRELYEF